MIRKKFKVFYGSGVRSVMGVTSAESGLVRSMTVVVFLLLVSFQASASNAAKRKSHSAPLNRAELKEAERRLSEMGYWTGIIDGVIDGASHQALIAFQKIEGRKINGRLTRAELVAIRHASRPEAKDPGYRHVEVDLDRQVLLLMDDEGKVAKVLPVSTGSGRRFNEKGIRGTAYTPRGRFRIYGKAAGWKRSPLGLLYYPNYFSDGIAIHGNPDVPPKPKSHGCIRIPMFASQSVSRALPVGTIVLIYDKQSFVSAKNWLDEDKSTKLEGTH